MDNPYLKLFREGEADPVLAAEARAFAQSMMTLPLGEEGDDTRAAVLGGLDEKEQRTVMASLAVAYLCGAKRVFQGPSQILKDKGKK